MFLWQLNEKIYFQCLGQTWYIIKFSSKAFYYKNMKNEICLLLQRHGYMEQTDSCQRRGVWETGWKKLKGLTKTHAYRTHRHRERCGDSQREWAVWAGWWGQRLENGGGMRLRLGQWAHEAVCWWCFEFYTWNLYGLESQCHHNKFNKNNEIKVKKEICLLLLELMTI